MLRTLENKLAVPLTHKFNDSVETGIIAEDWKLANVTSITRNRVDTNLKITDSIV